MRSEGSGRECLLADYLELGKIKRHTCTKSYLISSFLSLSHTHREDWSFAWFYPKNSISGKGKLSQEREGRGEREEERGIILHSHN